MANWRGPLSPRWELPTVPGLEGHVAIRVEAAQVEVEKQGEGPVAEVSRKPKGTGLGQLGGGRGLGKPQCFLVL